MTGLEIKIERIKNGWTQKQLGKESGISQDHLSKIERGQVSPTQTTLNKIKKALNEPKSNNT